MASKINLETGEQSGLEKNAITIARQLQIERNNGIHLKAFKEPVTVI